MVVEEGRPVMVLVEKSGREKEGVVISPPGTTKVPSHLQMSLFHVSREERSSLSAGVQSSRSIHLIATGLRESVLIAGAGDRDMQIMLA